MNGNHLILEIVIIVSLTCAIVLFLRLKKFKSRSEGADKQNTNSLTDSKTSDREVKGFAWFSEGQSFKTIQEKDAAFYTFEVYKQVKTPTELLIDAVFFDFVTDKNHYEHVCTFVYVSHFYLVNNANLIKVTLSERDHKFIDVKPNLLKWNLSDNLTSKDKLVEFLEFAKKKGLSSFSPDSIAMDGTYIIREKEILRGTPVSVSGLIKMNDVPSKTSRLVGLTNFYDRIFNGKNSIYSDINSYLLKDSHGRISREDLVLGYCLAGEDSYRVSIRDGLIEREFPILGTMQSDDGHQLSLKITTVKS